MVPNANLKFRLVSTGHARNDRRISQEIELLKIPGVEIEPAGEMEPEVFVAEAEQLWFSLRVLIAFRHRLHVRPLAEFISRPGVSCHTWNTVEIRQREEMDTEAELSFYCVSEDLFAKAADSLVRCREQRELLHAAAWGYAASFHSSTLEGRLTNCVEAIERLVCVYEDKQGLEREVVSRENWRPVGKALRKAVDDLGLDSQLAAKVKQGLAMPVMLILQERIERMARQYQADWAEEDRELLSGLGSMIKARNDIVHGRLISDMNRLPVEALRARVVFERLFLSFTECGHMHSGGYAKMAITDYERAAALAQESKAGK